MTEFLQFQDAYGSFFNLLMGLSLIMTIGAGAIAFIVVLVKEISKPTKNGPAGRRE